MKRFCAHLDFLADEGYATQTVNDLSSSPADSQNRTVVITFDDGYADNLGACEALVTRGMRATWFIVSGSIGREPAWADDGRPPGQLLNRSELCNLADIGMEIGSHTTSHLRLPAVDDSTLMRELTESKAVLEDAIGRDVVSFAYPYGAWDERCESAVRNAGYRYACLSDTGWAKRDNNAYRLRRLTVFSDDGVSRFSRKLAFGSHEVSWLELVGYWRRRIHSTMANRP